MAFKTYKNNIHNIQVVSAFTDTSDSITLENGNGAILPNKSRLTVEMRNSDGVVIKREVVDYSAKVGDVLSGVSRAVEECVKDDTTNPKNMYQGPLDFSGSEGNIITISLRATADNDREIKQRIVTSEQNIEDLAVGNVSIGGNKTYTGQQTFNTLPEVSDPNTAVTGDSQLVTKKHLDATIAEASAISSLTDNLIAGEDISKHQSYFVGAGYTTITTPSNGTKDLGKTSADTVFGLPGDGRLHSITYTIASVGSPTSYDVSVYVGGSRETLYTGLTATGIITQDIQRDGVEKIKFTASGISTTNYYTIENNVISHSDAAQVSKEQSHTNSYNRFTMKTINISEDINISNVSFQIICSGSYTQNVRYRIRLGSDVIVPETGGVTGSYSTKSHDINISYVGQLYIDVCNINTSANGYITIKDLVVMQEGFGDAVYGFEQGRVYVSDTSIVSKSLSHGIASAAASADSNFLGVYFGPVDLGSDHGLNGGAIYVGPDGHLTNLASNLHIGELDGDILHMGKVVYFWDFYKSISGSTVLYSSTATVSNGSPSNYTFKEHSFPSKIGGQIKVKYTKYCSSSSSSISIVVNGSVVQTFPYSSNTVDREHAVNIYPGNNTVAIVGTASSSMNVSNFELLYDIAFKESPIG